MLVVVLLQTPFLRIIGSLLLLWVAVKLLTDEADEGEAVKANDRLISAVWTIAVADMVMSLDNVLAIAAVAKGNTAMLILGLVISIPLIVAGATLIMTLLSRFPILIWAGAGLLGWVAGEMLSSDPFLASRFGDAFMHKLEYPLAALGAAFVLGAGWLIRNRREASGPA